MIRPKDNAPEEDMKTVFLLGAGFTRAVYGVEAPLTDDIMRRLNLSHFPEIANGFIEAFPDIEQFVTALDLKALYLEKYNRSLAARYNEIRRNIVQQIVELFDYKKLIIDELKNYPHLANFIDIIPKKSFILTLNYDCVLDQGLYQSCRWLPFCGYGISSLPHVSVENEKKDEIVLLKLHGSCNFRNVMGNSGYFNVEINESIFPNISSFLNSRDSTVDRGPHVMVMSYVKKFHNGILRLWRKAIAALSNAQTLVIVGCALRDEDTFLRFALYHFGLKQNTESFDIKIIDNGVENCNHIKNKIESLVAYPDRQRITIYHNGLPEYLRQT